MEMGGVYTTYIQLLKETRRCQIPWNWSYSSCKPPSVNVENKPGPLQEQKEFLPAEYVSSPRTLFCCNVIEYINSQSIWPLS